MGQISRLELEYCPEIININWKFEQGEHGNQNHQDTNALKNLWKTPPFSRCFCSLFSREPKTKLEKFGAKKLVVFKPPRYCNPSACRRWSWPYVTRMKSKKSVDEVFDVKFWRKIWMAIWRNNPEFPKWPPKKMPSNLSKISDSGQKNCELWTELLGGLKDNRELFFGGFVNLF